MDPVTVITSAVAAGAASGLKDTAGKAVKDAYRGFITLVKDAYRHNQNVQDSVEHLAKKPQDKNRRAALEAELKETSPEIDRRLVEAAAVVFEVVRSHSPETAQAIGMDIGEFQAAALHVKNLQPPKAGGTGLRAEKIRIEETATFDNIGGEPPPKP
jgi:hypothetical protein